MDIGDQSVEVAAVDTVQFFNTIEVAEGMPVDDNVPAPFDLGNLVDGKADGLGPGDKEVQEQGRKEAGPDKGKSWWQRVCAAF